MDIKKIATLSQLYFSEEEQLKLSNELKSILVAFNKIKNTDTSGVKPLITPVEMNNKLRPDTANSDIITDELVKLAPESSGRLYKVPRVIT